MTENMKKLEVAVILMLPHDRVPSEAEIREQALQFRTAFPVSDEEFNSVIRDLHSRYEIIMDVGVKIFEEEHQPWLSSRKVEIAPYYWERYEKYLQKDNKWLPTKTTTLSTVTDDILDLMGDPNKEGEWQRRGLVMGEVQSGKTATYTGLCCKAADAGYRLIILLTGTMENLRKQTQERLDAGFVGLDSSRMLSQQRLTRSVGVGLIDSKRNAGVLTSKTSDFRSDLVNRLGFRLNALKEPFLVVIKKNKRILQNLETWLRQYNADANGRINVPMLLIDDEADNASVNTSANGDEIRAINQGIRSLLHLFTRASYVGFTATPFANIFIDPDSEDSMVGEDLFPRDFIYALEAPSNYMGAEVIFGAENLENNYLQKIEDAEDVFPYGHKSNLVVTELPGSMEKALLSFIIVNAIRDLRGEENSHRSMLVNVSRFTNVQNQVADLLNAKLQKIQQDIRHYSQDSAEKVCKIASIADLKKVCEEDFSDNYNWEVVQKALLKAALPIKVMSVNQRTGASSLDYSTYKNGLRVIAVGGNSLSRGLTLEGLCVSYFFRNSQMYDTLMQMGRWFGYRDSYRDLCRIWMTEEAMHWYAHITRATRELKQEIRRMQEHRLEPKDFGLKVRSHPDSLIVTARNKMRAAHDIERLISLSGQGLETPRLFTQIEKIQSNARTAERFITSLTITGFQQKVSQYGNIIWNGVHKSLIVPLLREFLVHPLNYRFQADSIASFVEDSQEEIFKFWDVVIPKGREDVNNFAGIRYHPQKRKVEYRNGRNSILVSGASARVGSRGIEREGLDVEQIQIIEEKYKAQGENAPDWEYREVRKRPLLMLHLVKAEFSKDDPFETGGVPLVALGLSFPRFNDTSNSFVKYTINMVAWRSWFESEIDDDVVNDDERL